MDQEKVVWVFKPIGWTPKNCIIECQKILNTTQKMAFAGRLDPMACGLLPIIINDKVDTNKSHMTKENLQNTYKTYQFKLILGLKSDTFDILGIVQKRNNINTNFIEMLEKIKQIKTQKYPPYSSKRAFSPHYNKQVPLWKLAKEDLLPDILPERVVDIQSISIIDTETINNNELSEIVTKRINSLIDNTNFRKEETDRTWKNILEENTQYTIYYLEARVSVGTYIRTIGNELDGIVYDICRVSVDDKILSNSESYNKFEFIYNV